MLLFNKFLLRSYTAGQVCRMHTLKFDRTWTYKRIIIYIKVKLVFVVVVLSVWGPVGGKQRNAHQAMTKDHKNYVYHI